MTVAPQLASAAGAGSIFNFNAKIASVTWTGIPNGEASQAQALGNYRLASAQVSGTFGVGGACQLEGSNDGVNWAVLKDINGTSATWSAGALTVFLFTEGPLYIRPNCTAGDGTTAFKMVVSLRRQALAD